MGASTAGELERILAPLRDRLGETAVLLDVDGTLAPIVARPEQARLLAGVPAALAALGARAALLGFVSGRALEDVRRLVGLPEAAYAGNHGMQLQRPGGAPTLAAGVRPFLADVQAFAERWPDARVRAVGARLEHKGATLSYHWREAPDRDRAEAFLREQVAADARAVGLAPTPGRLVLEVRPPVAVDKGTAVRALLAGSGARLALYAGDDRTDADAWRALRALREGGALEGAACVAVASAEVPPEVRAGADVLVDGPPGALAALLLLLDRR